MIKHLQLSPQVMSSLKEIERWNAMGNSIGIVSWMKGLINQFRNYPMGLNTRKPDQRGIEYCGITEKINIFFV